MQVEENLDRQLDPMNGLVYGGLSLDEGKLPPATTKKNNLSRFRRWLTKPRNKGGLRSLLCFSPNAKGHVTPVAVLSDYEFVFEHPGSKAVVRRSSTVYNASKTGETEDDHIYEVYEERSTNYYSLERPQVHSHAANVETNGASQAEYSEIGFGELPVPQTLPIQCSVDVPEGDSYGEEQAENDRHAGAEAKDERGNDSSLELSPYTEGTEEVSGAIGVSHGESAPSLDSGVLSSASQLSASGPLGEPATPVDIHRPVTPVTLVTGPNRRWTDSQLARKQTSDATEETPEVKSATNVDRHDAATTERRESPPLEPLSTASGPSEELTFSCEASINNETEQEDRESAATQSSSPGASSDDEPQSATFTTLNKPGKLSSGIKDASGGKTDVFEELNKGDKDVRRKDPFRERPISQDEEQRRTNPLATNPLAASQLAGPGSQRRAAPATSNDITNTPLMTSTPRRRVVDDRSHQLIYSLSREGRPENYEPISERVKRFINRHSRERNVEFAAIYQSPKNPKELHIMGVNAESLSSVVSSTDPRFPGYSFMFSNTDDARHLEEYNEFPTLDISKYRYDKNVKDYKFEGETMCGLILAGDTRARNSTEALYLVAPAHFVLSHDQCKDLTKLDAKGIDLVRSEVESQASFCHYVLNSLNSPSKNDTTKLPMFGYRHFKPVDNPGQAFYEFTNDLTLLQLAPEQVMGGSVPEPGHKRKHLTTSMTANKDYPYSITEGSFKPHYTLFDDIFPLSHHETLKEMGRLRVRVFIGQDTGYMIPCGERVEAETEREWTYAIEFITNKRKFHHGDCGLIVSVQNNKTRKLYPFGMFIGKSLRTHTCGCTVWVAVVLRQAIDDLEEHYGHLVSGLRPLTHSTGRDGSAGSIIPSLSQNRAPEINHSKCGKASDGNSSDESVSADSGAHSMSASRFTNAGTSR